MSNTFRNDKVLQDHPPMWQEIMVVPSPSYRLGLAHYLPSWRQGDSDWHIPSEGRGVPSTFHNDKDFVVALDSYPFWRRAIEAKGTIDP